MIFRRRVLPRELEPALAAFRAVLDELEPAKQALTEVLPTSRLPGRPLPDALDEFEERLVRARQAMPGWRRPELEDVWEACRGGLSRALDDAGRLRREAPDLGGFEGLLGTVQTLLDPLDPFEDAAARFEALKTRPSGRARPDV